MQRRTDMPRGGMISCETSTNSRMELITTMKSNLHTKRLMMNDDNKRFFRKELRMHKCNVCRRRKFRLRKLLQVESCDRRTVVRCSVSTLMIVCPADRGPAQNDTESTAGGMFAVLNRLELSAILGNVGWEGCHCKPHKARQLCADLLNRDTM